MFETFRLTSVFFCAESIIHKHLQYRKTMGPLTVELRAKLHAFKLHV